MRDSGYDACSDSEIFQVFDICYDYDIFDDFGNYLKGTSTLQKWADDLLRQETIYPKNYVKLKYLENHDFPRLRIVLSQRYNPPKRNSDDVLKGAQFIFNGQECGAINRPNLFEYDEIDWSNYNRAKIATLMKN